MKFAIQLTERELEIFNHYKELIEKEREIKPSELEVIAMLATQVSLYETAREHILKEGAVLRCENSYGVSYKNHPYCQVAEKSQTTIKAYLSELLLTAKAKAQLSKAIIEKDAEDDPLAMALKKRAERR